MDINYIFEKCLKYDIKTNSLLSEKYILWCNNVHIKSISDLRNFKDKVGISTCGSLYFYDKNGYALCLKDGKFGEYYRNLNCYHYSGVHIIYFLKSKLSKCYHKFIDDILSRIKSPHVISNYWINGNNIDLHILPPIGSLKHIQINYEKNTVSFYYNCADFSDCVAPCTTTISDPLYEEYDVKFWKKLLGKGLHYHNGDFSNHSDYRAFEDRIIGLYEYIGYKNKVLDVGCGWGGPANMIRSDLKCNVTCITPSIQQTVYCQNMGFDVLNSKVEDVNLFENYDVCMAIESFSHIGEKYEFLKNVYDYCDKLVMLVNCSCVYQVNELFSMEIYTPDMLKEAVESAGWVIQEFKNTRTDNKSNYYWSNNMNDVPKSRHMDALERHNENAIVCGDEWVKNNPVILVVATKSNKVPTRKLEIGLRDYEFNSIFKNLGIGVEVSDMDECIIGNLREIRSYINNNCLVEHPLKYGDCVTYGTMSVNTHPQCIADYYDKYSSGNNEYLISFNRFESKDGDKFISEHTDDYYDEERKLKYTCIAYIDTGYSSGGNFFVKHNNETITIESKVGRVIKFDSNVLHGANPFSSDGSRVTVALAVY